MKLNNIALSYLTRSITLSLGAELTGSSLIMMISSPGMSLPSDGPPANAQKHNRFKPFCFWQHWWITFVFVPKWCNLTTFSSFLFSCSLHLKIHTGQREFQHTAAVLYLAWLSEPPPVSRCLQQIQSQALGPVSSPPFGELVARTCPRPDGPPPGSCSGRRDCWWRGAAWSGYVFWSFCWVWCDSKPNMSVIITVV